MKAIFFREINSFFSSMIGFLAMGFFITITGLMLWFFPEYDILSYGYSTLESFFILAPILFLFIIPAMTMRLFSEEKQMGTLEWLLTKPFSDSDILLGKYFASLFIVIVSLLPTLIYYFSIYQLGYPKGNIDNGGVIGSYFGLILLASTFCAIGLFCSSITSNQIVAFILAAVFSALFFWGFEMVSKFSSLEGSFDYFLKNLGISYHYDSISRGVLDTRDLIYFVSLTLFFLYLTHFQLEKRKV
jgi:ABC-2 type transport system permease protein